MVQWRSTLENVGITMFKETYNGKKILITGNTGFKGSWLSVWLLKLGGSVIGYSKDIPTEPSLFKVLGLENKIKHYWGDVCDLDKLRAVIADEKPDFIFHMAAQAIVSTSYNNPVETFMTNTVGTMNVLESLRLSEYPCVIVLITSDKCYENVEWVWGYKETDNLGGKDVYSGSKGAAELVIKSYFSSFFDVEDAMIRLGTGRAGNVIGGGDWASSRIIADAVRAWCKNEKVEIRSPNATRPWQHVLEPLSGYLTLAMHLFASKKLHGEAFNFGPRAEQNRTVIDLLQDLSLRWGITDFHNAFEIIDNIPFNEAGLLKLNCDKALFYMKWQSSLNYSKTIDLVGEWYSNFYRVNSADMFAITTNQIDTYESISKDLNLSWVN